MGNATPPINWLPEEPHCYCNICSTAQVLYHLRGVIAPFPNSRRLTTIRISCARVLLQYP